MLQKKLEDCKHSDFNSAFIQSIGPFFKDLMVDQFGNYLCQKIIEVCSPQELMLIVDLILPDIVRISMDVHGTRSV